MIQLKCGWESWWYRNAKNNKMNIKKWYNWDKKNASSLEHTGPKWYIEELMHVFIHIWINAMKWSAYSSEPDARNTVWNCDLQRPSRPMERISSAFLSATHSVETVPTPFHIYLAESLLSLPPPEPRFLWPNLWLFYVPPIFNQFFDCFTILSFSGQIDLWWGLFFQYRSAFLYWSNFRFVLKSLVSFDFPIEVFPAKNTSWRYLVQTARSLIRAEPSYFLSNRSSIEFPSWRELALCSIPLSIAFRGKSSYLTLIDDNFSNILPSEHNIPHIVSMLQRKSWQK